MIYKYILPNIIPQQEFNVNIPKSHKFLDCQMQGIDPVMWFDVNPNDPFVQVRFLWIWTGQSVPPSSYCKRYLKTVQLPNGNVAHLYTT